MTQLKVSTQDQTRPQRPFEGPTAATESMKLKKPPLHKISTQAKTYKASHPKRQYPRRGSKTSAMLILDCHRYSSCIDWSLQGLKFNSQLEGASHPLHDSTTNDPSTVRSSHSSCQRIGETLDSYHHSNTTLSIDYELEPIAPPAVAAPSTVEVSISSLFRSSISICEGPVHDDPSFQLASNH